MVSSVYDHGLCHAAQVCVGAGRQHESHCGGGDHKQGSHCCSGVQERDVVRQLMQPTATVLQAESEASTAVPNTSAGAFEGLRHVTVDELLAKQPSS
jgi:hypothetical protein